jgi:hypothetical protein
VVEVKETCKEREKGKMKRIVVVHKSYSNFPAMCTNCLEKSDLTTYEAKLKEKKREGNKTTLITCLMLSMLNEAPSSFKNYDIILLF